MLRYLLLFLLWASCVHAQTFGTLTVVPNHTTGLVANWVSAPPGTNTVTRWTDANTTPVTIGTSGTTTFTDTTAAINTIYYYRVVNGAAQTNTAISVNADITKVFNCPPMVPVDPSLLGVDRQVSFISANGTLVNYTIFAPNVAGKPVVNVPPCAGAPGCSDYNNVNNALRSIQSTGGTVQLSAGKYNFLCIDGTCIDPAWSTGLGFNFNISTTAGNDIILAGANVASGAEPTTILLFNQTGAPANNPGGPVAPVGIVNGGNRQLVRNVRIEWNQITAIPGVLNNIVGDTAHMMFTVTPNPSYYVPDPMNPPKLFIFDAYNFNAGDRTAETYVQKAGARWEGGALTAVFNPAYPTGGYFYTVNIVPGSTAAVPDGTSVIMWVSTRVTLLPGTDAFNTSYENIRIYSGGGGGLIQGPHSQGLRLSNFVVERKPDALLDAGEQSHYVSLIGDNDSNGSKGNVLIENSQFGFMEDDSWYARGGVFKMASLNSTSSFTVASNFVINHSSSDPDNSAIFMDPVSLQTIGSTTSQLSWVVSPDGTSTIFTITPPIPELAPYVHQPAVKLPIVGQPNWSAPNIYVNNSCSHDNHGRFAFLNNNGLVENTVMGNGYFGPLVGANNNAIPINGNPQTFIDGPGVVNHIWRNNKIISAGYGSTDLRTIWAPLSVSNGFRQTGWMTAAISVQATNSLGYFAPANNTLTDMIITGNYIQNTPGLCISAASVTRLQITNNICVDANQIAYTAGFDAAQCGYAARGWAANGSGQPWCLAKVPSQGAIMVVNSANVTATPNTFLGTSAGLVQDPPILNNVLVGVMFKNLGQ